MFCEGVQIRERGPNPLADMDRGGGPNPLADLDRGVQIRGGPNPLSGSRNRTQVTLVGGECSHHCAIPSPQS